MQQNQLTFTGQQVTTYLETIWMQVLTEMTQMCIRDRYNSWTLKGDWKFNVDVEKNTSDTVEKDVNVVDENGDYISALKWYRDLFSDTYKK